MNTLQNMTPETTPAVPGSFRERARATWLKISLVVVSAHPSITEVGARQRAQLQATFSIIVVIMFAIGAVASLASRGIISANEYVLIFLAALGLAAYFISRTRSFGIGGHLLTGGVVVAAFAFLFTGQGSASALDSFIPLSMVLGSLLLSPGGLIFWISLSVTAIFFIPPEFGINVGTVTGNYITLGALLTVSVIFRNTIERSRLGELRTINASLRELQVGLEERVAERTRNLELAARVGRTVSQVRSLDIMLKDACELILKEFDLYYVQVYLTNPSQTALQLQAGTGEVGAQLRQRGHSLQLNTGSINGRAAVEKRSVVISDTTESGTFRPNPLLPDTRGEMTVPLIIADRVVGVLDMQSRQPGTLTEEVLPAFEALAGQLAVAVQNANLLKETEQTRAEVESQARRLARTAWDEHLDAIHKPEQIGFVFDRNEVTPLTGVDSPQLPEQGRAVSAPISLTGEVFGSLVVELDDEAKSEKNTELINIVARQVAQQLENLRLLESAERYRFEAEQASRRLTRAGWQDYRSSHPESSLGYLYNQNEIRPLNADQPEVESAFTLPVKARDEVVGKLAVQGLKAEDTGAVELASAVAERLGTHIESLRQFNQAQSALAQNERLTVASLRFAQASGLQDLVKIAVESMAIPKINRALLDVFNFNAANEMESMTSLGNWWSGEGHEPTPVGTTLSADVMKSLAFFLGKEPFFSNDTFNDPRADPASLGFLRSRNIRALASLPLYQGDQQIGSLILEAEEPYAFTNEEIRLFIAMGPQIATVLENRRQFERAQRQAERETMLNTISQKIQSATSVEAVLQIAARELGHALGAPMTIAQLSLKEQN